MKNVSKQTIIKVFNLGIILNRIKNFAKNHFTAQKPQLSVKDFFSKCDQICSFTVWSHLLKKYLMGNFIFCAVIKMIIKKHLLTAFLKNICPRHTEELQENL